MSDEYFDTLGIPVIRGRAFDAHDTARTTKVVVVNEAMAAKYWPGGDALNRRLTIVEGPGPRQVQVIGIARTVKYNSFQEQPQPVLYFPIEQSDPVGTTLFVATDRDPTALIPTIRSEVTSLDRDAPIVGVRTMLEHVRQQALLDERLTAQIVTVVAIAGLTLAIFGLYSVTAHAVSQRTHEIGIRLAVGATTGRVLRMALVQGLKPAAFGIAAGIPLVLALRAIAADTLAPADPLDSLVYVVVLLVAVTVFACYIPARRASRVDPNTALRCE